MWNSITDWFVMVFSCIATVLMFVFGAIASVFVIIGCVLLNVLPWALLFYVCCLIYQHMFAGALF